MRLNINILGVSEVRWSGNGDFCQRTTVLSILVMKTQDE